MENYEYKCVPVPSMIATGNTGKNLHSNAVTTYEKIINEAAIGGWILDIIDTVSSSQKAGCLGMLMGKKDEVVSFKMLVFRRKKS